MKWAKLNGPPQRTTIQMQLLRMILGTVAFPAVLFLPAGRLNWPEAWAFLLLFFASLVFLWAWLTRRCPTLAQERRSIAPNVEKWDKILMRIYSALLFTMLLISALDGGRLEWTSTSTGVRVLAWVGLGGAMAVVWWTLSVNPFASRFVRIQDDRGHRVISTGPYKHLRHPMYAGVIVFALCTPLVLGSWYGAIPAGAIAVLFVIRTALEDRTLVAKLPGYSDYANRVCYRLIPRVW